MPTGILTGVWANVLVDTPADILDECRPTYLSTCQQTVNRYGDQESTNTWLTRWPIVPTSTQPRGVQITQDLLFQGQFTCWNFTLTSPQLVGGDVNKPTMRNTFRRSEQLHTCQKPCQKRNCLLPNTVAGWNWINRLSIKNIVITVINLIDWLIDDLLIDWLIDDWLIWLIGWLIDLTTTDLSEASPSAWPF